MKRQKILPFRKALTDTMDSYAEAVNRATDQIQGLRSNAEGQADEYQNAFLGSVNDAITNYETKGREILSGDMGAAGIAGTAYKVYKWTQGAGSVDATTIGTQMTDVAAVSAAEAAGTTGAEVGLMSGLTAAEAIPGLGILAAVGVAVDALVHLFHHKKTGSQANIDPTTLAQPSASLISSYSQALPSFDSVKDHASSVAAF